MKVIDLDIKNGTLAPNDDVSLKAILEDLLTLEKMAKDSTTVYDAYDSENYLREAVYYVIHQMPHQRGAYKVFSTHIKLDSNELLTEYARAKGMLTEAFEDSIIKQVSMEAFSALLVGAIAKCDTYTTFEITYQGYHEVVTRPFRTQYLFNTVNDVFNHAVRMGNIPMGSVMFSVIHVPEI